MDINQISLEWSLGDPLSVYQNLLWLDEKYLFYGWRSFLNLLFSGNFENHILRMYLIDFN